MLLSERYGGRGDAGNGWYTCTGVIVGEWRRLRRGSNNRCREGKRKAVGEAVRRLWGSDYHVKIGKDETPMT